MDFTIKQGDTRTVLKATLYNPSRSIVDLTGATVQFTLSDLNSTLLTKTGTVQDAQSGVVWIAFADNDLDNISGYLNGEIKVTFPDNRTETYPNDRYLKVNVVKKL